MDWLIQIVLIVIPVIGVAELWCLIIMNFLIPQGWTECIPKVINVRRLQKIQIRTLQSIFKIWMSVKCARFCVCVCYSFKIYTYCRFDEVLIILCDFIFTISDLKRMFGTENRVWSCRMRWWACLFQQKIEWFQYQWNIGVWNGQFVPISCSVWYVSKSSMNAIFWSIGYAKN